MYALALGEIHQPAFTQGERLIDLTVRFIGVYRGLVNFLCQILLNRPELATARQKGFTVCRRFPKLAEIDAASQQEKPVYGTVFLIVAYGPGQVERGILEPIPFKCGVHDRGFIKALDHQCQIQKLNVFSWTLRPGHPDGQTPLKQPPGLCKYRKALEPSAHRRNLSGVMVFHFFQPNIQPIRTIPVPDRTSIYDLPPDLTRILAIFDLDKLDKTLKVALDFLAIPGNILAVKEIA